MSGTRRLADVEEEPYNTLFTSQGRDHLYREYGVDRAFDEGFQRANDRGDAPPDYRERRRAILSFYGHRCGRCGRGLAERSPEGGDSLGYVYALGTVDQRYGRWALDGLVATCGGCYDLLANGDPDAVEAIDEEFREAPQFPAWTCDPRVAVERAPLTGRELWLARLARRLDDRDRFEFAVNEPVAEAACLALETPASTAVAYERRLARRAADRGDPGLRRTWESIPDHVRRRHADRICSPREIARAIAHG